MVFQWFLSSPGNPTGDPGFRLAALWLPLGLPLASLDFLWTHLASLLPPFSFPFGSLAVPLTSRDTILAIPNSSQESNSKMLVFQGFFNGFGGVL